jgi:hypothetical protein
MSIFNNHIEYYIYIFYMIIFDSNFQMDLLIPTHGRSLALAAQAIRWRVSETTGKLWLECSIPIFHWLDFCWEPIFRPIPTSDTPNHCSRQMQQGRSQSRHLWQIGWIHQLKRLNISFLRSSIS